MNEERATLGEPTPTPTSNVRIIVPTSDITSSPAAFLIEILERAERAVGTELLAFGTDGVERLGELLLSRGQICLVKLSNEQSPLGTRLQQSHPETAAAVREALTVAKAEGRSFSDVMSGLGAVDSGRIREALLDQIAEGLVTIGRAAPAGLFESSLSASRRQLSSVLSGFAPAEIYWRTIPLLLSVVDDAASRCFKEIAALAGMAVLFAVSEGTVLPVQFSGTDPGPLESILKLGRHVEQIAHAPALASARVEARMVLLGSPEGSVLFVITRAQIAMFGALDRGELGRALGVTLPILETHGS
jgi:hypothetical protein